MFRKEYFGDHPDYWEKVKALRHRGVKKKNYEIWLGRKVKLEEIRDPRHPEVVLIPRDMPYFVTDDWDETIFIFAIINFPFSSFNFYVDEEYEGIFAKMMRTKEFQRLGGISQLGYLVPPRPEDWEPGKRIAYLPPAFIHTRWLHSLSVPALMDVVLGRSGFTKEERVPVVLAAGYHDIAIPAGGDPVMNIDFKKLNEEKNFSLVLEQSGLAKEWKEKFNFDLKVAQQWIKGKGMFGLLLDVLDKISYVMIDCQAIGIERPGRIRDFCLKHPLIGDIWQDIKFTENKKSFGFICPKRVYDFLILRALENVELLFNPDSRKLDLYLVHHIKPLYEKGIITKEKLLLINNIQLESLLKELLPDVITSWIIEPDKMSYKRFETLEKAEKFSRRIGEKKTERIEKINPFNPGLYFPIISNNKVFQIRDILEKGKIKKLENLAMERAGYYVYYYQ